MDVCMGWFGRVLLIMEEELLKVGIVYILENKERKKEKKYGKNLIVKV